MFDKGFKSAFIRIFWLTLLFHVGSMLVHLVLSLLVGQSPANIDFLPKLVGFSQALIFCVVYAQVYPDKKLFA